MQNWSKFRDFGLYLVTDEALCKGRSILDVVRAAVAGGVQSVQIREKHGNTRDFLALAKLLVREIQPQGVPIIINDRVDIALASGAAGVHIGQSDMPVHDARIILGEKALIGVTIPTKELLANALTQYKNKDFPVQYIAVSPVFLTSTKKDTAPAWGLDGMQYAREQFNAMGCDLPFVTIGGINEQNAKAILDAGVDSLAIVSAICSAENPEQISREIRRLWK